MQKGQNRFIIAISIVFFLITQTIIMASVPNHLERQKVNIVIANGTSLNGISEILKQNGVISSRYLFLLCSMLYGGRLIAGEYELSRDMSTIEVVRKMGNGERKIYVLRVIEGHNIYNIAESIDKAGIMKADEFLKIAKDPEFLISLGIKADTIEGYLSPETYFYSREIEPERFIGIIAKKTLNLFEREDIKNRMTEMGLDVHSTLTIASMIEKEARLKDEKPLISAVFHNRLKRGMSLDCDPTIIYGTGRFATPITKKDITTYTPYNTYRFKGLPRGPICSPDYASIKAALNPAPVDYLYFVSKNDGTHVFSKDMREHNRFVYLYQRAKKQKNHL
ncbi:MAG TPA: endolytic transglycosylase MltG [Syntrophorhabdaceae bacterium]|mgnify:CR=1 FL=1|nr:endolytic transglycosylase MltG [Syntrophorhabdaceae bacterium]HOT42037.1 endolytic transglycosylase MltG [Syntrophorhabdaceae bacterium]HPC67088.1 endolytic transglycosylase MltG [Syntrophorhabdaceae bacterium]HQE80124.1 endolytic transglycosylase MltG [Syntrophorhabdaceae bacterium]HQH43542.1 endolytic transglycosylase MltG [Syntrophorhabdaceae bacterium]